MSLREDAGSLWIRLRTRASDDPVPRTEPAWASRHESVVSFRIEREGSRESHDFKVHAFDSQGPTVVLERDGHVVAVMELDASMGQATWNYTVQFQRHDFFPAGPLEAGDRILDAWAMASTDSSVTPAASDRAPSVGFANPYILQVDSGLREFPRWGEVRGVDYAAGPSVAVDANGNVLVAYIRYRGDGDVSKGLYVASISGAPLPPGGERAWQARRVADAAMPTELHEDGNTQTAIAADAAGRVHVLYHPYPNSDRGEGVRYAMREGTSWRIENPAKLADGRALRAGDSFRDVIGLAASSERVVAAFQTGNDVAIVERTGPDAWTLVQTLQEARFPRLALDPAGKIHVAWFHRMAMRGVEDDSYGALRYASESEGWQTRTIATGIEERTQFWNKAEPDGSFAFALDSAGIPHFVWEGQRQDRRFGILRDGVLVEERTPLRPDHGNPQIRMRMLVDDNGRAHVVSGYGGSDLYAVRHSEGGWGVEGIGRFDVFSLAMTPDGRVVTVYTEPHGGTTVAVRIQSSRIGAPEAGATGNHLDDAAFLVPGPAGLLALAALGGAAYAGTWGARRTADVRPEWVWRPFAAVGGFSRIAKSRLLEHSARDAIVQDVGLHPGAAAGEVRTRVGLARSTFFYHLDRLEREGLVRIAYARGQMFLRIPGTPESPPLMDAERRLLEAVVHTPGLTAAEYARRLGADPRATRNRLGVLEREGYLAREAVNARDQRFRSARTAGPDAEAEAEAARFGKERPSPRPPRRPSG